MFQIGNSLLRRRAGAGCSGGVPACIHSGVQLSLPGELKDSRRKAHSGSIRHECNWRQYFPCPVPGTSDHQPLPLGLEVPLRVTGVSHLLTTKPAGKV